MYNWYLPPPAKCINNWILETKLFRQCWIFCVSKIDVLNTQNLIVINVIPGMDMLEWLVSYSVPNAGLDCRIRYKISLVGDIGGNTMLWDFCCTLPWKMHYLCPKILIFSFSSEWGHSPAHRSSNGSKEVDSGSPWGWRRQIGWFLPNVYDVPPKSVHILKPKWWYLTTLI